MDTLAFMTQHVPGVIQTYQTQTLFKHNSS